MRTILGKFILATALIFLVVVSCCPDSGNERLTSTPLLNGLLGESEWQDAETLQSDWGAGNVWIKADSQYVYLCISPTDTVHSGVDLYVDNLAGDIFNLHISSAHGQRFLIDTLWEEMDWGSAGHWTANLVQSIWVDGRTQYLAPEAFEFQIDRHLLPGDSFKIMLHLKRPTLFVPENADMLSSEGWLLFGVDRPVDD